MFLGICTNGPARHAPHLLSLTAGCYFTTSPKWRKHESGGVSFLSSSSFFHERRTYRQPEVVFISLPQEPLLRRGRSGKDCRAEQRRMMRMANKLPKFSDKHKICIICEGNEEYEYLERLKALITSQTSKCLFNKRIYWG